MLLLAACRMNVWFVLKCFNVTFVKNKFVALPRYPSPIYRLDDCGSDLVLSMVPFVRDDEDNWMLGKSWFLYALAAVRFSLATNLQPKTNAKNTYK
jgi:hypothetical protein